MKQIEKDVLRYKVIERDNFKCCVCGCGPEFRELQGHHIEALNLGRKDSIDNKITVCIKHHRSLEPEGTINYNNRLTKKRIRELMEKLKIKLYRINFPTNLGNGWTYAATNYLTFSYPRRR